MQKELESATYTELPKCNERRREQAQELQGRSKPNDFVQWMTDLATTDEERDPANIAHRALIMSQASIPPAALAATHTLYDLCAYPEYVTPIIEEAAAVMKEEGGLCPKALYRMLSFQRTVGKPLTLSDGLHIPRDAQICVASSAITMDLELYEHPERFDGWRYYKKRLNSAEENRHQFTSVDREWLHFGYGNHACPGRFFTSNQVKMIVIHFLRNYEIAFRSVQEEVKLKPKPHPILGLTYGLRRSGYFFTAISTDSLWKGTINKPIAVVSPIGPTIFLPNSFASEIRNMKELNFSRSIVKNALARAGGLDPILALDYHEVIQEVVRIDLTRSLDSVTEDVKAEAEAAISELLGDIPDWKIIDLNSFLYRLVARVSSRVFLGPELADNAEWLDIASSYVTQGGMAARKLRGMHPLLRVFARWWLPELRVCRQQVAKARRIIEPLVQDRLQKKAHGKGTEKTADMLSWLDDKAKAKRVKIDFAKFQLLLVVVAVHTTAETVSMLMADLIENENAIPRLREEMVSILSTHDWKKTSLASMTLLDSAMKESQRMNPITDLTLQRTALRNVTLSDGTIIPKDYRVAVEHRLQDSTLYPNPDQFELDRFLKLRGTDRSKWNFVTGSPEHLGFGYGRHTCPGRFFASNEIKVIVTHLLLKYDWNFTEKGRLPNLCSGTDRHFDPRQTIVVKSRKEHINLSSR
ncbi:cytochrome P450 [Stemphylium lycopersici]|uniref:Cytochrome P450 n=1 Tax=Stemphylium lycopersici TaxID=183478 RepID=A0A364MTS9_STELY|nr:cytochrome P450 [Stemphylium lycopersici]RAR03226.1 cytochrome P450 [Stemphylium lycopersici]